jgi:hypothetical protein
MRAILMIIGPSVLLLAGEWSPTFAAYIANPARHPSASPDIPKTYPGLMVAIAVLTAVGVTILPVGSRNFLRGATTL